MAQISYQQAWEKLTVAVEAGKGRGKRERRWSRPQLQKLMRLCLNDESEYMAISETATLLQVHTNTVRLWANKGYLKCYRLGKRGDRRFKRVDVVAFLEGGKQ